MDFDLATIMELARMNGISLDDVRDVMAIRKAKGTYDDPVLCVIFDNDHDKQHIIDGNHRIIAKALEGHTTIAGHAIPFEMLGPFAMQGVSMDGYGQYKVG